jgi:hypothetical protein
MGLKSASFAYRESHDGSQVDFFLSAPESDRAGIFKILAAAPESSGPPAFVPADAVKFWRWRVDSQKSWDTLQTMLADISPGALGSLNVAIAMANANAQQKDPDFDVRKNLIGNLGDDFMSYQKAPAGESPADLNNAPSLFLFAAANPGQAVLAIKNLASIVGGQSASEPRDFLGKKIYSIPLAGGGAQIGGAPAPASSLYFAASGGYVAISKDSPILENFLRSAANPGRPLSATAGLADAAQHVGGAGGGLFGYQDQRESMRFTFEGLKDSAANPAIQTLAAQSVALGLLYKSADFSLLPDYDKVAKYFYFSVFGGGTTADGISFKFFAPRPPQLN